MIAFCEDKSPASKEFLMIQERHIVTKICVFLRSCWLKDSVVTPQKKFLVEYIRLRPVLWYNWTIIPQSFLEVSLKLNRCQQFGLQQIFVASKRPFSCIFFGINPFSRSNSQLLSIACHTLQTRRANVVRVHLRYRGALLVHTMRLQNFAGKFHIHFYNIRDSVLFGSSKSKDLVSWHQSLTHGQHDIELLSIKLLPALTAVTCCCQLWLLASALEAVTSCCQLRQLLQAAASFDSCYKLLPALTAGVSCRQLWQLLQVVASC